MKDTKKRKTLSTQEPPSRAGSGYILGSSGAKGETALREEDALLALDKAQENYRNREPFSYDVAEDPFYQRYRDQYIRQGQLGMEDTVGKVTSLTGGYANSYAQTAGQQTYEAYLRQLDDVLPELYGDAYDRYMAEGEALYREVLMAQQDYENAADAAQREYDRNWQQQQWVEDMNQQSYQRRQETYDRLVTLIQSGYVPTDAELQDAGMTREQAQALAYQGGGGSGSGGSGGSGGGGGGSSTTQESSLTTEQIKQLQQAINDAMGTNLAVDGIWGNQSSKAAGGLSVQEAWEQFVMIPVQEAQPRNWAHVENDVKKMKEEGETLRNIHRFLGEELKNGTITVSQYNDLYLKYGI